MRKSTVSVLSLGLAALSAAVLAALPGTSGQAMAQSGAINGSVIRFCENQNGDNWTTSHAPTDPNFFHQELVLGEGNYSVAVIPNGRFRFNAFVYVGNGRDQRYIGGAKDVASFTQRISAGSFGEKVLIQLVKTTRDCQGCSVTMSLRAFNCPQSSGSSSLAPCARNQCYDPGEQGLFGLPIRPPQCVSRPGANGGTCGSPGN